MGASRLKAQSMGYLVEKERATGISGVKGGRGQAAGGGGGGGGGAAVVVLWDECGERAWSSLCTGSEGSWSLRSSRGRARAGPVIRQEESRCGRFRKDSDPALAVYLAGDSREIAGSVLRNSSGSQKSRPLPARRGAVRGGPLNRRQISPDRPPPRIARR